MRKVKKNFKIIFILLLAIILFSILHFFLKQSHTKKYNVKTENNKFKIVEKFISKKDEIANYFFEISINDEKFYFQTYENYNKKSKIIKDIYYYENNSYKCIRIF